MEGKHIHVWWWTEATKVVHDSVAQIYQNQISQLRSQMTNIESRIWSEHYRSESRIRTVGVGPPIERVRDRDRSLRVCVACGSNPCSVDRMKKVAQSNRLCLRSFPYLGVANCHTGLVLKTKGEDLQTWCPCKTCKVHPCPANLLKGFGESAVFVPQMLLCRNTAYVINKIGPVDSSTVTRLIKIYNS